MGDLEQPRGVLDSIVSDGVLERVRAADLIKAKSLLNTLIETRARQIHNMSLILKELLKIKSDYRQNRNSKSLSKDEYQRKLSQSFTVYVGNLSFYTSQWMVHELFSKCGRIKRIIMGHNNRGQSCGFCFVEYQTHEEAAVAVQYLSRTILDGRKIRVDWDMGYTKGRQLGRGTMGYQKRDVFSNVSDPDREINRGSGNYKRVRQQTSRRHQRSMQTEQH